MSSYHSDRGRTDLEPLVDLIHLAEVTPRQPSASATPEEVELVVQTEAVARALTEHGRRVMTGQGARWGWVADMLAAATEACRRQERLELTDDAGDSGVR